MNALQWLGIDNPDLVDAGDGQRLHADIIGPFTAMQQSAAQDGIGCQLVSGFRDFDRQLAIWNRKWSGELPLYSPDGEQLNTNALSDTDKLHAILTFSALPGGSRHHWGTDIDVFDKPRVDAWPGTFSLVNAEYRNDGPCAPLAAWLDAHASRFGFNRPFKQYKGGVAQELWHLSHRETAKQFETSLDSKLLKAHIESIDIAGKQTILANFSSLFERYILNKGA